MTNAVIDKLTALKEALEYLAYEEEYEREAQKLGRDLTIWEVKRLLAKVQRKLAH